MSAVEAAVAGGLFEYPVTELVGTVYEACK